MRFGFIGFRPLHLFPFSSFPLRTPGGSSVVPVHLVSLSSQPHTLLSRRLPFHVFILLSFLRAHLRIGPSLNFASPRGGVCV